MFFFGMLVAQGQFVSLSGPVPTIHDHASDAVQRQVCHPISDACDRAHSGSMNMLETSDRRAVIAHTEALQQLGKLLARIRFGRPRTTDHGVERTEDRLSATEAVEFHQLNLRLRAPHRYYPA